MRRGKIYSFPLFSNINTTIDGLSPKPQGQSITDIKSSCIDILDRSTNDLSII